MQDQPEEVQASPVITGSGGLVLGKPGAGTPQAAQDSTGDE